MPACLNSPQCNFPLSLVGGAAKNSKPRICPCYFWDCTRNWHQEKRREKASSVTSLGSVVVWVFVLLWGHWKGLVATSCMCPLPHVRLSPGPGGFNEVTRVSALSWGSPAGPKAWEWAGALFCAPKEQCRGRSAVLAPVPEKRHEWAPAELAFTKPMSQAVTSLWKGLFVW